MIIKSFEIDKIKSIKKNIFLIYGENKGLKSEIVNSINLSKKK